IPVQIASVVAQVEDRVGDELAWTVIGCLPATRGFNYWKLIMAMYRALLARPAEGHDRIMLKEQERVADLARAAAGDEVLLQACGGFVVAAAEAANVKQACHRPTNWL
ncbi:MAG: hypothetical protein ABFD96_10025, partial [Armatimonadia bacterium]